MYSELILFLFVGWAISSTVVNGSIFDGLRNWFLVKVPILGKLFSCVRCFSFWVGLVIFGILTFINHLPSIIAELPKEINYLIFPFLQSGVSVVIESFVIFLIKERNVKIYEELKSEHGKNSEYFGPNQ